MKIFFTVICTGLMALCFGQNTIEVTGDWCSANLKLKAVTVDEVTVVKWKKDGVVLPGETANSISCTLYGKGVYEVVLVQDGSTSTLTYDISEMTGPTADFGAENMLAAGVTYFSDQSVSEELITNWNWDFGDGQTATAQNPKIMFAEEKTYTIKLTVTTASGCTHTITKEHEWAY